MAIIQNLCNLLSFYGFIVTELQIYQNFTKRPVLQHFSKRIIQHPRQYLQTSWSIFTPTLPTSTSLWFGIPDLSRKSYKNYKSLQPFSYILYLLSSPQSLAANCIWSNFYGNLKYAQYSSKFIFPSPTEWDLKTVTKTKIWFLFLFCEYLVLETNIWGWWKEKCLSRLKPRSI